jgi:hypothetical protein
MLPITATATPASTVRISDALNILKHLAQLQPLTAEQVEKYDFFGDGRVTINNALEVLKYLAKQPSRLKIITPVWEEMFIQYLLSKRAPIIPSHVNEAFLEYMRTEMYTAYVKTYSNGFAFFCVTDYYWLLLNRYTTSVIAGNIFYHGFAQLFFYEFETSNFLEISSVNENEILSVLSAEELTDLSERHTETFFMHSHSSRERRMFADDN